MESDATEVHDGYFSIDKKGTWTEHRRKQPRAIGEQRRDDAYNLIMRGQGEAAELRDKAEVHLLPLRAARRLGQPERLPDLRPP